MRVLREITITILVALLIFILLQTTVQSFVVEGQSMAPGIVNGQFLLVNKIAYLFRDPQPGEVIVFKLPEKPIPNTYIKRVIATPGDTIEIKDGKIYLNSYVLEENYIREPPSENFSLEGPIPTDCYFVLGDNRNNSHDSRKGWFAQRNEIIGKAWLSLWPPDKLGLVKHYKIYPPSSSFRSPLSEPYLCQDRR